MVVWKTCHRSIDLYKETGADSKANERSKNLHAACLANSCQGKDAEGLLFRLNYTIHQHTGIGCDTST